MRRGALAAGLAGALVVVSAAGCASGQVTTTTKKGSTRIVVGYSIGPISLLESKAKVEAAYGKGQQTTLGDGQIVTFYPAASIGVRYYGDTGVGVVETASPRYRTTAGLGVGSGIGAVRKIGADCGGSDSCNLGGDFGPVANPATSTVFYLNDRGTRVVRIEIALAG